jgi:hypothetical protein
MEPWIWPAISLFVGVFGSGVGMYVGMKLGQARLEWRVDQHDTDIRTLTTLAGNLNEDSRVHDFELEDVMRALEIPRKRRQNWRFVGS